MRFSTLESSENNPQITEATVIGDRVTVQRLRIGLSAVGKVQRVFVKTENGSTRISAHVVGNSTPFHWRKA